MCIVTRQVRPVDELIRFVIDPDGAVVPDPARKLPGRGVWVSADLDRIAEAERKRLFDKAFGIEAKVEPGLADRVARSLRQRTLGTIGLARKAGAAISGFAKVSGAIAAGKAIAVLHAADAAPDGVRKLETLRLRHGETIPTVKLFDSGELSLALGSTNVIHAALLSARPGEMALERITALSRLIGPRFGPSTDTDPSTEHADVSAGPNAA